MNTHAIDNNYLKATDISNILRNIRLNGVESPNELLRYQLLEVIIRVVFTRYVKSNIYSQSESLEKIIQEFINLPSYYNSSEYRTKKYFNFLVDKSLKKHLN